MRLTFPRFLTAILFLSVSLFSTIAPARVQVKETTKYYEVNGKSGSEIYRNMVRRGPRLSGIARKALAVSRIDFRARNIRAGVSKGRCRIVSADIYVSVQYTLPKWRGSSRASRATKNAWSRFSKTVVWHEKQHGKIAKDHAASLERSIKKLRPQSKRRCVPAAFKVSSKIRRLGKQHERRQAAFDRKDLGKGGRGYKAQLNLLHAK